MENELSFNGLYGEDIIHLVRDSINIVPITTIMERNKYYVKPHKHKTLFQLFFIEECSVNLHCYDQVTKVDALSIFTVPKNVLHGISSSNTVKGWVISISDFGLEKTLKLDVDIFQNIEDINVVALDLNNSLHQNLYHTLLKCIHEFNDDQPVRDLALEYLTGMLIIRLFRVLVKEQKFLINNQNSYKAQYRRFRDLIKANYSFKYGIEFYADKLNISSSHLTRICRSVAHDTPKRIIAIFFINEAKILLAKVDYSISDVAYKLGFEEPSYFTRLFKKITKDTPRNYRRNIGL